jgi:transposase
MSIITVGIDLAKNVFAVHGVDDNGKPALVKPKVSREHLLPLIAQCRRASSAWKPAPARTTGRGSSASTATP